MEFLQLQGFGLIAEGVASPFGSSPPPLFPPIATPAFSPLPLLPLPAEDMLFSVATAAAEEEDNDDRRWLGDDADAKDELAKRSEDARLLALRVPRSPDTGGDGTSNKSSEF